MYRLNSLNADIQLIVDGAWECIISIYAQRKANGCKKIIFYSSYTLPLQSHMNFG